MAESVKPKKKRKVGRPTKYYPEIGQEMIEYFDIEPFYTVEREVNASGKEGIYVKEIKTEKVANQLPTFARFAQNKGVNVDTLAEWRHRHKEFSAAYSVCKELQKQIMIINGMSGLYQSNFTIFAMKNMHKWTDRQEISHEGKFSLEGALTKTIEDNRTGQLEHDKHSDAVETEYTEVDDNDNN